EPIVDSDPMVLPAGTGMVTLALVDQEEVFALVGEAVFAADARIGSAFTTASRPVTCLPSAASAAAKLLFDATRSVARRPTVPSTEASRVIVCRAHGRSRGVRTGSMIFGMVAESGPFMGELP